MPSPNAVENNADAGFTALAGFLFMYLSNHVIKHRTGEETLAFGGNCCGGHRDSLAG